MNSWGCPKHRRFPFRLRWRAVVGQHCDTLQANPVPGPRCTHASFTRVWAASHTSGGQSHKKHLGTVSLLSTGISKQLKPTLEVKAMVKWIQFFSNYLFWKHKHIHGRHSRTIYCQRRDKRLFIRGKAWKKRAKKLGR